MKKRYRRKKYSRRRSSLSASNWGPVIKLLLFILGGLALAAFLTLFVMVMLEAVFHVDTPLPPDGLVAKIGKVFTPRDILVVTPTPYVSPVPTATPHPMHYYNAEEEEKEVVLSSDLQYYWFGDPTVCGDKMLFSAGKIIGDNVRMCALLEYDMQTGAVTELPVKPKNANLIFPVFNDQWLVYIDGKIKGGGEICALRINELDREPLVIKTVYTGQPELRLDGHYISWIERTGTNRDKLFVCDLETTETTVVDMFTNSSYGTSAPYMHDGTLIWAAEGTEHFEDGRISSVIKHIDIESSGIRDYSVDTYVHDPKTNGEYFAWLNAHHSDKSALFAAKTNGDSMLDSVMVAENVVDFAIDKDYLVYSVDEVIYVYFFNNGQSYRITPERELAQLLGASEGYVIWMDVTTRQRDVLKIAKIPVD